MTVGLISAIGAAVALAALVFLVMRTLVRLETRIAMPINPQIQALLDAEAAEAARLRQIIADQAAKLAADDVASNAAAAKIAELTAATDPTETIAALAAMVETLKGIGVAPAAPPANDPVPPPVAA